MFQRVNTHSVMGHDCGSSCINTQRGCKELQVKFADYRQLHLCVINKKEEGVVPMATRDSTAIYSIY